MSVTKACAWDLHPNQHTEVSPPQHAESLIATRPPEAGSVREERVLFPDERQLVAKQHFMPGGKYRSIVKLFLLFDRGEQSDQWFVGTGWLVRDNLLVTAGHCAYGKDIGQLTHVKAYIGYSGQDSVSDPSYSVQLRVGKKVVTPQAYVDVENSYASDVSFILLSAPFEGVTPINFSPTPRTGSVELGVVGYPGDLKDTDSSERGACQWEMWQQTRFDLSTAANGMLQYTIDTAGGNSGGPVFSKRHGIAADANSIGVHVLGGEFNSATVIGQYGNNFAQFLEALDAFATNVWPSHVVKTPSTTQSWLTYITVSPRPN